MLSKNKIKFLVSLQKKKSRDEYGLYLIEGDKMVKEYISAAMPVKSVIAKPEFLKSLPADYMDNIENEAVSYEDLKKVSTLKTPHNAIAVVAMPEQDPDLKNIFPDWCLALDFIQDPGNLGTIIRAAAWFGIRNIVCSEESVDAFNPKVIQASMGALIHVNVVYSDLAKFLNTASGEQIPVYGSVLDGESVYTLDLSEKGIVLLGNESKGISENLIPYISRKLTIPRYSNSSLGIDSLNVGMAASIIISEVARRGKEL